MGKRQAYVIILAAVLIPVILKKEMQEFKIISILLFVALFCFIVLIII
jgi:amino acid permease